MLFKIIKQPVKVVFSFLVRRRVYFILLPLFYFVTKRVHSSSKNNPNNLKRSKTGLFALHPELFRGDLEILAGSGVYTVYKLSVWWQWQIIDVFYPRSTSEAEVDPVITWYESINSICLTSESIEIQQFFSDFLPRYYKMLNVDCVIVANIRYFPDLDWTYVSKKLCMPSLLIFRESVMLVEADYLVVRNRHASYKQLIVDFIIAHNHRLEKSFLDSGIVTRKQIRVCGNLRMDDFAQRVFNSPTETIDLPRQTKKRVVFIYLPKRFGRFRSDEYSEIHDATLEVIVDLAKSMTDTDFVIRPKAQHLPTHKSGVVDPVSIIEKICPEHMSMPNLSFDIYGDAHELILSADVVCGLLSTVLLESALANKPVIIPFFDNFSRTEKGQIYPLKSHLHLFDVARNMEEFRQLILCRLETPSVHDSSTQKGITELFEESVSIVDGCVFENTKRVICEVIDAQNRA